MTAEPAGADRPNRLPWPPIIYAATLVLAVILDRILPLGPVTGDGVTHTIGVLVALAGIAVALAGILQFRALGTTFHPTGPSTALASGGVYARTRNPMYLGAVAFFSGIGLAFGSMWLILLMSPMVIALNVLAIDREEAYLTRRFGAAYEAYRTRIPRWL